MFWFCCPQLSPSGTLENIILVKHVPAVSYIYWLLRHYYKETNSERCLFVWCRVQAWLGDALSHWLVVLWVETMCAMLCGKAEKYSHSG